MFRVMWVMLGNKISESKLYIVSTCSHQDNVTKEIGQGQKHCSKYFMYLPHVPASQLVVFYVEKQEQNIQQNIERSVSCS